jgi:hypothetical protein
MSKEIILVSRPANEPSVDNFTVKDIALPEEGSVQSGELLVKMLFASVDPYMRGRLNAGKSYFAPWDLNAPPTGGVVAEILHSKNDAFKAGDYVVGHLPWRLHQIVSEPQSKNLNKIPDPLKNLASYFIGACGMPGLSAHLPIEKIADAKPGEVAFVSGAAGAVGSVAGQLLKLKGLKVYGSAGTDEKVAWLKELGFDGAFNYNTTDLNQKLGEVAPEGVDVFFDNVGGSTLEILLNHMKRHGRVIMCGSISNYNKGGWEASYGVRTLFNVTTKSLLLRGFIVSEWIKDFPAGGTYLVGLVKDGKIKVQETVVNGFENIPKAFVGLFSGQNIGKMVVKI